eukprot:CAMPEP_0174891650 /NCGR_PEP_ID=MMETSP0167-20121228/6710_1 /TAXON_ID=38298 /ORGANISM="Rhodella maculata, Strain CCMP736" /LENGTH=303 /DNA_ID=CAMNT_0016129909 /DNA_START=90 /DNA_END=1001 /DNA_ORIENTATION=-
MTASAPPRLLIRDPTSYAIKRRQLAAAGPSALQVITDFDGTLSRYFHPTKVPRERNPTCHVLLEHCPALPDSYREEARRLLAYYYPLEVDLSIPVEKKLGLMVEWWSKAHDLLLKYTLTRMDLTTTIQKETSHLRDQVREFLETLSQNDVPVLVFSAGIADILEEVLRQQDLLFDNTHVISNRIQFDPQTGQAVAFDTHLIHSFNKNETAAKGIGAAYWDQVVNRNHVLLLGDSLTDVQMAEGTEESGRVLLTIGFLNDKEEERAEKFSETFDVVVLGDGSFELPLEIVSEIMEVQGGAEHEK